VLATFERTLKIHLLSFLEYNKLEASMNSLESCIENKVWYKANNCIFGSLIHLPLTFRLASFHAEPNQKNSETNKQSKYDDRYR